MSALHRSIASALRAVLPKRTTQGLRRARVSHVQHPYLRAKGWYRSAGTLTSVDERGRPIPWITYPARMMLERVVSPNHKVFEYGSGNSSLWWATRAVEIYSVENDAQWAAQTAMRAPANLKVIHEPAEAPYQPDPDGLLEAFLATPDSNTGAHDEPGCCVSKPFAAYALAICRFGKEYFDIVVVDGMARALTAWMAMHYMKPDGLIVFDDTDRIHYQRAYRFLGAAGFKRVDFWGLRPIVSTETCTSIFAKSFAWLGHDIGHSPLQKTEPI